MEPVAREEVVAGATDRGIRRENASPVVKLPNAGDTRCTIIEIISPAGFENYFREVSANWGDLEKFAQINQKYSLDMDFDSVPALCERFGLSFPEL